MTLAELEGRLEVVEGRRRNAPPSGIVIRDDGVLVGRRRALNFLAPLTTSDKGTVVDIDLGGTLTPTDLLWAADTELTISSGVITATQSHHTIDTQADAATDDLDTINGLTANQLYFFYPANGARTVVLKHGTGNLLCIGNQDFELNDAHDFIWAFSPDGSNIYVGGPHNAPVFISGTEPTSIQDGQLWLDTAATGTGGLGVLNVTTITGNTTLTTSQTVVLCNAASGAITVTLPAASGNDGLHYHIKKIDSSGNAVTIDGNGSETIDGETTQVITMQYNSLNLVCDGSEWHIL